MFYFWVICKYRYEVYIQQVYLCIIFILYQIYQERYQMQAQNRQQIFPRKLSKDFHGIPKPNNKYQYIRKSATYQPNPQSAFTKITKHIQPARKKNQQIHQQRQQWIEHPAKISNQMPDFWLGTHQYYKRSEFSRLKRQQQSKTIDYETDVFNQRKLNPSSIIYERKQRNNFRITPKLSHKIGYEDRQAFIHNKSDITPKVGSVDTRDYSIRKPHLKIGSNSFVDTYSVF